MPALPPVPGVAQVVLKGTVGSKKWANVFHAICQDLGPISQADLDAVATGFANAWNSEFTASLSTTVTLLESKATDLSSDTGLVSVQTVSHAGLNGGTPMPPQVAYLLNWTIARRYRGGHPRTYLPGVVEADVDGNGVLASGRLTTLKAAAASFRTDIDAIVISSGHPTLACVHYFKNGVIQSVPIVDQVLAGTASDTCATQRRRLR